MGHDNANAENNQSPRQSRKHSYLPRRPEVERREGCTVKIIQELRWISQPTVELASRPIQVCCNSENLISALRFRELVVAIEHLSDESVFGALRQHARTDSGRHWCGKPPLSPWRPSKTVDGAFARGLGPTLADISRLSFGAARCGGAQARRISMRAALAKTNGRRSRTIGCVQSSWRGIHLRRSRSNRTALLRLFMRERTASAFRSSGSS
jgi:hypothetical protein